MMVFVVTVCLAISSVYSVWVYQRQLSYCNEAAQTVARNNLCSLLDDLSEFNRELSSNDVDFSLLSYESSQISIGQIMSARSNLRRLIDNRVPSTGAILMFNRSGTLQYHRLGNQFGSGFYGQAEIARMYSLRERFLSQPDAELSQWQLYVEGDTVLLCNARRLRDLYICSMVDLNAFANAYAAGTGNIHYIFYTEDAILTHTEYAEGLGLTPAILANYSDSPISAGRSVLVETDFLPGCGVHFASVIPISGIWSYSRIYALICAAVLMLISAAFLVFYVMFRRILIYPLSEISRASRRLSLGGASEPQEHSDLEEYLAIQSALNQLVEQKVQLTRENENRIQEKNHALLQYYQLQTRSHFFLNCLKSIYSMTSKGQTEKTKRMILCFSSHLRYIFHDTLSLVTLEAELTEVNDYYQIIQLDRQYPIFLETDVPQELMDCRVPPLTIQTFVENSYKYNNDPTKLLRFRIQADQITMDDKQYLRLRLSDNGKGYSKEVLDSLEELGEVFETHHVGIKNLRRRIGILYDGDYQMAFLNGRDGGAVSVIYLPMKRGENV